MRDRTEQHLSCACDPFRHEIIGKGPVNKSFGHISVRGQARYIVLAHSIMGASQWCDTYRPHI